MGSDVLKEAPWLALLDHSGLPPEPPFPPGDGRRWQPPEWWLEVLIGMGIALLLWDVFDLIVMWRTHHANGT